MFTNLYLLSILALITFVVLFVIVVQSLSHVQLFVTQWTAARQASLYVTIFRSLLKFLSIELVILSNHLILCCPLLLLPSIFPRIRVFSNESALHIRWPDTSLALSLLYGPTLTPIDDKWNNNSLD